jgi:carboxymethylenebutenolidase
VGRPPTVVPPHQPDPLETFPERFNATASLFGTRLITDDEGSVHHCVPTMQGKVYRGVAEHDPSASLPMVEEFTKLLERCAAKLLVEVCPGTVYGYEFPGRIVYHQDAAEWSWARIFAMFERQIAANPPGTYTTRRRCERDH